MIDHLLFNKLKWFNVADNGEVKMNGETRYTGVPTKYLGNRVKSTLNDSDTGLSLGTTGTVVGVTGYIITPNVSVNDSAVKSGIKQLNDIFEKYIIVRLDNGRIVYTPSNWFDLF